MSVNSRMKEVEVYCLIETTTPSGAKRQTWTKEPAPTPMAIYQLNQFVSAVMYRSTETTHFAVTHRKNFVAGKTRIKVDGHCYQVEQVDREHRMANLSLKEIQPW